MFSYAESFHSRPEAAKKIQLIHAPFWLGGGRAGAELGPESIVEAGMKRQLKHMGLELAEEIVVDVPRLAAEPATAGTKMKYLAEVKEMAGLLGEQVHRAAAGGRFPLVLGGDHSIAIGTLAGLTGHRGNLGLIWFDAHGDLNTEETTPSGNIHGMALAAAIGRGGFTLADIPGAGPFIRKENVVIIGARDLDPGEREFIRAEGIRCFTMHEIDRMGIHAVMEQAIAIAGDGTDGVHVSFDLDVLDPLEACGVGTPVPGGLNYREAHYAMELLAESGLATSLELVEVNPLLDPSRRTSRLAVELAASLLGKRIL
ncbi:arginase [Paenibacillus pasadenensis]|uniref:Arginase n=1 Tax=Paenibacillus pasadenensis TaxID=217090 RepID=A0A2N5NAN1_9BACL|nr:MULTISPECIES: arginase [Paenibacillus]PLT47406.1 Arginase [Paenibacillus pasadenensis]QGG57680.1 arginase [Paenibacillus sp. B01]